MNEISDAASISIFDSEQISSLAVKSSYSHMAKPPAQAGPEGIFYDFNKECLVLFCDAGACDWQPTEFHTPYRVINSHTGNSCWNDPKERFNHQDFLWCPRHAGTPRQFECPRRITAQQVIEQCKNILKQKGK